MTNNFFSKKLPTVLAILLLIAGLAGLGFWLNKKLPSWQTPKPTPTAAVTPDKIHLSSVFDNQFIVSWITAEPVIGFVKYGAGASLDKTSLDDRDQLSGEVVKYKTHFVTIKNLEPDKTYSFKVGLSETKVEEGQLFDHEGQPFTVTTGPTLSHSQEDKIVTGRILDSENKPAAEVIVYLNATNIAPLGCLTDNQGRWSIFLNTSRTQDLQEFGIFDVEATVLKIEADGSTQSTSAIILTKNILPQVPDLVLGHEPYDFRENSGQVPEQLVAAPVAVAITNPSEDGEKINTPKPEFRGQGPADLVLTIKIESSLTYTGTATIGKDGSWQYTAPNQLTPGDHKISVSYTDKDGKAETLSRNFVVLAAGESELPSLTATPSGQPALSPSPLAKLSPSPSQIASPSASASGRISLPSTEEGMPSTGVSWPTITFALAGILLIFMGVIFSL